MEAFRLRHDKLITLIPGMIQHHGDGMVPESGREFSPEFDDTDAIDLGFVRHGNNFMGYGMEGP
jgi:hypothetical protein